MEIKIDIDKEGFNCGVIIYSKKLINNINMFNVNNVNQEQNLYNFILKNKNLHFLNNNYYSIVVNYFNGKINYDHYLYNFYIINKKEKMKKRKVLSLIYNILIKEFKNYNPNKKY